MLNRGRRLAAELEWQTSLTGKHQVFAQACAALPFIRVVVCLEKQRLELAGVRQALCCPSTLHDSDEEIKALDGGFEIAIRLLVVLDI